MHSLSIPTWVIHISSVLEWMVAIALIWRYAAVTANAAWRSLSWAMFPALASAMCACTWHFFENAPDLQWLVPLQAGLTLVGNIALLWAASRIYRSVSH